MTVKDLALEVQNLKQVIEEKDTVINSLENKVDCGFINISQKCVIN